MGTLQACDGVWFQRIWKGIKGGKLLADLIRVGRLYLPSRIIDPSILMRNQNSKRQSELPLETEQSIAYAARTGAQDASILCRTRNFLARPIPDYISRPADMQNQSKIDITLALVSEMLALVMRAIENQDCSECERCTMMALRMVPEIPDRGPLESSGITIR
jgi:hypothetical protein